MYYQNLPAYVYELSCGDEFRSLTRSEPDDDGWHWFYCDRCRSFIGERRPVELRPMTASGRVLGDGELAKMVDAAIHCDRIAAYYRRVWDAQTTDEVAVTLGVSRRQVKRVALDLGVYEAWTDHRA